MPNWHEQKVFSALILMFLKKIKDGIHVQTYMCPENLLVNLCFDDFSNKKNYHPKGESMIT